MKNSWIKKTITLGVLTCSLVAGAAETPPAGSQLWYEQPAKVWFVETLTIGNGRLGAVIFGGMAKEHLQFNENSLWVGDELDTGAYQNFGELFLEFCHPNGTGYRRELDLAHALHTITYTSGGVNYRREYFASHPDGIIVLRFTADKPGAYSGILSLTDSHEATISATGQRITASGSLAKAAALGPKSVGSMAASSFGAKDRPYTIALDYESQVLLQPEGGTVEAKDGKLAFTNVSAMTVFLAAGTDFVQDHAKGWRGAHPHAALAACLDKAATMPYATLLNEHIQDYQKLFGRLRLDLGGSDDALRRLPTDKRLEAHRRVEASTNTPSQVASVDPELEVLLYQYARYLMISCSRSGGIPANLQGLWNCKNAPIWRSDFHTDINFQMNYWFVDQANLTGCFEPFSEWIWSVLPPKRAATQRLWSVSVKGKVKEIPAIPEPGSKASKIRGFVFTSENGLFGGGSYKFVLGDAAWLAQNIWDHYAFTQDRSYLETRAYPILKELCEFWEDNLKERPDGKLVSPESHSPEHGGAAEGNSYEQQLVYELFSNFIEASKILGRDQEYMKKVDSMRSRLLGPQIGKWGQLQEWANDIDNPQDYHRHTSHLLAVYPCRQITPAGTPQMAKAAAVSLTAREAGMEANDKPWEWVWGIRAATWARLGEAENSYRSLIGLFNYNIWPSGLAHASTHLQVDGNFCYAAAVGEMLIQSHEGNDECGMMNDESKRGKEPGNSSFITHPSSFIISLLPALPKAWPTGSVKGICARGGFTVDMSWKDGKVTDYRIVSAKPKKVRIQIGSESKIIESAAAAK
jgi:alpha-L-fucosidase 2